MPVPKSDALPQVEGALSCSGCLAKNVIARLSHHFGLLERPSDSHPVMTRLSEHLTKVYGQEYVESGKLKRRLDFVREAWLLWRDQLSQEKWKLTISEAYNLAAMRLNWKRSPVFQTGIEKSQPREEGN